MTQNELLAYYTAPGVFTGVAGFESEIGAIPGDVRSITRAVQELLIDQSLAPAYQVRLSPERLAMQQLHSAVAMLACASDLGGAINEERPAENRVAVVCRHFATLFVAIMRHKGVPCRARCGFANYFEPGKHVDHWVGEYWHADERRWILVDAQIDSLQQALFQPDFDTLDVPRNRFLVAGDAWRACRSGTDPMTFGVSGTEMWGLVEVMGDVMQDLAALQNIELLPWGWYGLAKGASEAETDAALISELAGLSSSADAAALDKLRTMVAADDRIRVPAERVAVSLAADEAIVSELSNSSS